MIAWEPFRLAGVVHDLSHLHPRRLTLTFAARDGKPAQHYIVDVIFGLHCFTRAVNTEVGDAEAALRYRDKRETRIFCHRRYALSFRLPEVVASLLQRPCYHTGKGNFLLLEWIDEAGIRQQYEIYIAVARAQARGVLRLYVQSAYVRERNHIGNRPKRRVLRTHVLLFNTLHGKPIRFPS